MAGRYGCRTGAGALLPTTLPEPYVIDIWWISLPLMGIDNLDPQPLGFQ